jgi:hypothetical protein
LDTLLNMLMLVSLGHNMGGAGHLARARIQPDRTRCHSRETRAFGPNVHGMTQLRSVFAFSEVKNA